MLRDKGKFLMTLLEHLDTAIPEASILALSNNMNQLVPLF